MKKIIIFIFSIFICSPAFSLGIEEFEHETPVSVKNIQFSDEQKNIHNLNDFRGKVVLLNFWATWCTPCIHELPAFEELKVAMEGRDVEILAVSIDYKGVTEVRNFFEQYKINSLPVYWDEGGRAFTSLKLRALPVTFIIDKESKEVARIFGEIEWNSKKVKNYLIKLSKK